jgi:glycerol-1-phosphate dehydrogenase [NAD(P)+]
MQAARTSRPASGAEHQFSHLWDMQHHTHHGDSPSHGFKVGIGSLASMALYEELLAYDMTTLNVETILAGWPPVDTTSLHVANLFDDEELKHVAISETQAKYPSHQQLEKQLRTLQQTWPDLREKLKSQLIPFDQVQAMLRDAGCPTRPEEIGISRQRLRHSYCQALAIRRRFTVLDLAERTALLEPALERIFGRGGRFA